MDPWVYGVLLLPLYLLAVKWAGGKLIEIIGRSFPRTAEILSRTIN